jgi:hypothetical protein
MDRQGQPLIRVDAPTARSAELNQLLAHRDLFAAEIHPYEGSLEEVFMQLTTPVNQPGRRRGMEALASSDKSSSPEKGGA